MIGAFLAGAGAGVATMQAIAETPNQLLIAAGLLLFVAGGMIATESGANE